jgi:trimeric autotransporter adhesin
LGDSTLFKNSSGYQNTAIGSAALNNNTTGFSNTAFGAHALDNNTWGLYNTAVGHRALFSNLSNHSSTAVGARAMEYAHNGTSGLETYNTAVGVEALRGSTTPTNNTGRFNTAIGDQALANVTSGSQNVGVGHLAGATISTGSNNIAIGYNAQVPFGTASNQVRVGNTSISYAGIQVNWTCSSDKRWKEQIAPLSVGTAFIRALRPVVYHRKNNPKQDLEWGFIAQAVQATLKELSLTRLGLLAEDENGYLSIRYNDLIPVLIQTVQEQQARLQKSHATASALSDDEVIDLIQQADSALANTLLHQRLPQSIPQKHEK